MGSGNHSRKWEVTINGVLLEHSTDSGKNTSIVLPPFTSNGTSTGANYALDQTVDQFKIIFGSANDTFYLDDIYVDSGALNFSTPISEVSYAAWIAGVVGLIGVVAKRSRSRRK